MRLLAILMTCLAIVGVQAETALQGYDAVAYQTENRAVVGQADFKAEYEGKTYVFASAQNKEIFAANPARYVPAYGGYCAYGVAQGAKVPVDPHAFAVIDGTLYLNVNQNVQQIWAQNPAGYIRQADQQWPLIK